MHTHVIQELNRHLDIGWLAGDDHQSLALPTGGRGRAVHAYAHSTRLHDLDLARAHMPDLINLAAAFPNDAPD